MGLRDEAVQRLFTRHSLGTAYTVWTGIGAVGAFVVGIVALGEPLSAMRVLAAVLIVCGLVLMPLASHG